ncbi:MAG TPA: DNA polymerase I [Magnetospirillaceae bacterium]|jgi:DNA polymerase-1
MADSSVHHLCLVDGSGYIFRAFHAIQPMTRPDGTPVNAVYGFTRMLMKLVQESKADHIAVIFDAGRATFRNEIYPEYKAHRPDPPEELIPQFALVREATRAIGVPAVEMPGFEADDLIATYARHAVEKGGRVTIVSSDKDLMQLIRPGIEMFDPLKERRIGPEQVFEKFGVKPDRVVDVQALAGDATDNVPGVPGIGVKTAAQLIDQFGDLDTLLARAGEIPQPKRRESLVNNAEAARVSRELVRLRHDVPVKEPLENLMVRDHDQAKLIGFLQAQGFKSILLRMGMPSGTAPQTQDEQRKVEAAAASGAPAAKQPTPPEPSGPATYEMVVTEEALVRWVAEAQAAGMVSVDTETNSLDPMRAALVGVSLSVVPGRACYIPVIHNTAPPQGTLDLAGAAPGKDATKILPRETTIKLLKPLLEDPSVLKIGHNIKFDMKVLAQAGIDVGPVDDTLVLSFVLEGSSHGHGMDELADLFLGHTTIKYEDVCGSGKNQITFDRVPLDKATDYAAEDAEVTLRLYRQFKPRLLAEHMVTVYETLDRPLIPVLKAMERAGIKVDRKELEGMSVEFGKRMVELEGEVHKLAGMEFNVGSPKQLGEVLFDKLGLPGGKKGKTGAYATGADVLEQLAPLHELPRKVLDWRQISKLKSTYADALVEEINPATGRVHTNYGLAGASTGRLSSNDPNLQNIPIRTEEGRRIRKAFIADKGHVLLSADYSQIELRLVAHVADIEGLKQAFADGADIHAITASQVFGIPVKGMDPMVRRRAKAINFGIIYGISAFGLAAQLGIPQGEARAYIDAYFAKYPEIRAYMEATKSVARKQGYVETLFGRKCFVPGINDKNGAMRAFSERAAINAPIQGGAADIIKRAMIRLPDALAKAKSNARMLLQVHDELVFEVPEKEADDAAALVKGVMEDAATLSVPLVVDTGTAHSWAEAH